MAQREACRNDPYFTLAGASYPQADGRFRARKQQLVGATICDFNKRAVGERLLTCERRNVRAGLCARTRIRPHLPVLTGLAIDDSGLDRRKLPK